MSNLSNIGMIESFRKNVDEGKSVVVTYVVSGGAPGERINQKITIGEDENVKLEISDEKRPRLEKKSLIPVNPVEQKSLLEELAIALDKTKPLLYEPDNVFLPDSVVSSLTVQVGNESLTLYFLSDEIDRKLQNKPIPEELAKVIEKFNLKFAALSDTKNG